ncbi:MAG: MerR family transcriptional regulator [Pseudomonadota bacterium]|nr:MerR family transcriptional regulator [Pseudomonadota bacterium]
MKQKLTIGDLATAAGVSVRTLRHYDEIGLLSPAFVGDNGYRYYGRDEFLRLQQIMLHREMQIPLKEIADLLERQGSDYAALLAGHRERLAAEAKRYRQLLKTIDRTIAELESERDMKTNDLYKGFSNEKQEEYESWLVENYGVDMRARIDASKKAYADANDQQRAELMRDLEEIETALAAAMKEGTASDTSALDPLLESHRAWVGAMWSRPCPPDAYSGLADLYLSHPDFRTRFETIAEGFTNWLTAAMKAHAARQGG